TIWGHPGAMFLFFFYFQSDLTRSGLFSFREALSGRAEESFTVERCLQVEPLALPSGSEKVSLGRAKKLDLVAVNVQFKPALARVGRHGALWWFEPLMAGLC
ncbi:hypothetical protein Pfo_015228, partial [Paulownia fortunei]